MSSPLDMAAVGYPGVRQAFNATLQLCVEKLSDADIEMAEEILGLDALAEDTPGVQELLADTALYSQRETRGARKPRRAIDRIAPRLGLKKEPLQAEIAARLPAAIFSVFAVEATDDPDISEAHDLLDKGRTIRVMDQALSALLAEHGEMLIAARFADLGPWHLAFGIVVPLRKSEAVAITLAAGRSDDGDDGRGALHELIYPAHLHGEDLVMAALEPMITALAMAIDTDMIDVDELTVNLEGCCLPRARSSRREPLRNGSVGDSSADRHLFVAFH